MCYCTTRVGFVIYTTNMNFRKNEKLGNSTGESNLKVEEGEKISRVPAEIGFPPRMVSRQTFQKREVQKSLNFQYPIATSEVATKLFFAR